jgi:hypothetical protein
MNTAMAQSAAFSEVGHSAPMATTNDPWRKIEAEIAALAKAKGITAREGSAQYAELLGQVLESRPELTTAYRQSLA